MDPAGLRPQRQRAGRRAPGRRKAFRSLGSIDTSTPGGGLIFHVFRALAEFERELIRERTYAGLAAARTRGRQGGRPTVMTPERVAAARTLLDAGDATEAQIATTLGVSCSVMYRALAAPMTSGTLRPESRSCSCTPRPGMAVGGPLRLDSTGPHPSRVPARLADALLVSAVRTLEDAECDLRSGLLFDTLGKTEHAQDQARIALAPIERGIDVLAPGMVEPAAREVELAALVTRAAVS